MRPAIEKIVDELVRTVVEQAAQESDNKAEQLDSINGQLNFAFFKTLKNIFSSWFSPSYAGYARAVSILECCKGEIERRLLFPYEDKKISENGDVS